MTRSTNSSISCRFCSKVALAKPVWMLVPDPADFRWMEDREDTPWYPTMRLFRQQTLGDWSVPFARMAEELAKLVESRNV